MLLWWFADDPTLSDTARDSIMNPENWAGVSAATAWEISIKRSLGKLQVPDDLIAQIGASRFQELQITAEDGFAAGKLPHYHDDPFDRMLVAQAKSRGLTIVTRDDRIAAYDVQILPA